MEENLGTKLRSAREAAGITIDDVVHIAKLPRAVVLALEAEDFGFFTSSLYARSFLKQYSEYIGADVSHWIDDLVPTTLLDGETIDSFIDLSTQEPSRKHGETAHRENYSGGKMAAVWMILITGGLFYGGLKVYENLEEKFSQTNEPAAKPPISPEPPPQATPTLATQNQKNPTAATEPEPTQRAIIVHEE